MSIFIYVRDRNSEPMKNVNVRVQFTNGFTHLTTDGTGKAELKVGGYIKFTEVYGNRCDHRAVSTKDVESQGGSILHKMP